MTNKPNIYPIDTKIADGKDSYVYMYETAVGPKAYKIYKEHIAQTLLQDYHSLHTRLSQYNFLSTPRDLSYQKEKVEYIQRSILPLDGDSIGLCSDRETKEEHTISYIPYIPGDTLYEGLIYLDNGHSRSTLILELESLFQDNIVQAYPNLKPYDKRQKFIDLHNIKIISRENGILKCIITDLGKSIPETVSLYKKREPEALSYQNI